MHYVATMPICLYFCDLVSVTKLFRGLVKVGVGSFFFLIAKTFSGKCEVLRVGSVTVKLYLWAKINFYPTFHIFWQIWVKLSIKKYQHDAIEKLRVA